MKKRPSPGTEQRPRDKSAKSRASSWRGKTVGAGSGRVLHPVGWTKDVGFILRAIKLIGVLSRGLTQSDFCFEECTMAAVWKIDVREDEWAGKTIALQQVSQSPHPRGLESSCRDKPALTINSLLLRSEGRSRGPLRSAWKFSFTCWVQS